MSRTFAGETTQYLYNGHEDIGSYRDTKCLDLKILSSKEGSLPLAIELGDQQYAPLISSHGHIVGLVEMETGNLADQSQLTLFGKDLAENPLSPWRFCGKRHEEATLGIIDFGYRFYHPKSAQWLTQDPLGESSGPNLYTYVNNNPACCVDRFGLFMDNFSFSSAWESFKDTCSNSWDSFKDTCSNAWESARDYGGRASNASTDHCDWIDNKIDNPVVDFGDLSILSEQRDVLGSLALDCTPVVGSIKSAGEFIVGHDLITGEETSRWISLAGLIPCSKLLTNMGKGLNKIANVSEKVFRSSKARNLSLEVSKQGARKHCIPDPIATGAHTVFRRNPSTGKVTHYETYALQTNPKNPSIWEFVKRYDNSGQINASHFNKVLKKEIYEPHVHDPLFPGGVRPAAPREIPN